MNLRLRFLSPGDIEAVFVLAQQTSQAPQWSRLHYENLCGPESERRGFVAEIEGSLAGFAIARCAAGTCELESIVVVPNARKNGLGAALMWAVRDWAVSCQATRLELEVRASNQPAIRLYEHIGMREEGRRRRYYSDPEEDAVLMGTEL